MLEFGVLNRGQLLQVLETVHMDCRAQNLPAGGKLPLHQFTALVPSSSHFCSLLSVVPLVFSTSGLPRTPVYLVGLKQLPSPPASSPPQISPGTPLPIPRVSLAPRSQAGRTIHTFAPQPVSRGGASCWK